MKDFRRIGVNVVREQIVPVASLRHQDPVAFQLVVGQAPGFHDAV